MSLYRFSRYLVLLFSPERDQQMWVWVPRSVKSCLRCKTRPCASWSWEIKKSFLWRSDSLILRWFEFLFLSFSSPSPFSSPIDGILSSYDFGDVLSGWIRARISEEHLCQVVWTDSSRAHRSNIWRKIRENPALRVSFLGWCSSFDLLGLNGHLDNSLEKVCSKL